MIMIMMIAVIVVIVMISVLYGYVSSSIIQWSGKYEINKLDEPKIH